MVNSVSMSALLRVVKKILGALRMAAVLSLGRGRSGGYQLVRITGLIGNRERGQGAPTGTCEEAASRAYAATLVGTTRASPGSFARMPGRAASAGRRGGPGGRCGPRRGSP